MGLRISAWAIALMTAAALTACAGSGGKKRDKFAYVERPVEILYENGANRLERKRYEEAVAYFEEVERQHPYSSWARRAMLMKAFAYYQNNDYEDAVKALDQFIALHPGNKDAPYAYYLKAMSHYERITDVGRDQENTNNAVAALNDVIRRYPNTEYARDARLKLDLTKDHLAGKEMYVGRYYLRANKHIAAINRFKHVLAEYQTTSHVPEALHRLVEAYLELGVVEEARAAAAVLGHNYPGSDWYADTYRLLERRKLLDDPRVPRTAANVAVTRPAYLEAQSAPLPAASAAAAPANDGRLYVPQKSALAPPPHLPEGAPPAARPKAKAPVEVQSDQK